MSKTAEVFPVYDCIPAVPVILCIPVSCNIISQAVSPQYHRKCLASIMDGQKSNSVSVSYHTVSYHTTMIVCISVTGVLSTVLLAIACVCLASYHLHLFTMASHTFIISPIIMVTASSLSLILAILSAIVVLRKSTNLYMIIAVVSLFMFILQIMASVFSFLLMENMVEDLNKVNVTEEFIQAVMDKSTMSVWDNIQRRYKCCGGKGSKGFHDWDDFLNGTYPDSCCTVKYPHCGLQAHRTLGSDFAKTVYERIHAQGCITAAMHTMEQSINPLLMGWGVVGIGVSMAELGMFFIFIIFMSNSRKSKDLGGDIPHESLEGEL